MKKLLFPMMALALVAFSPVQADDTPLAEEMDKVNDAFKSLRRTDDMAEGAKLAREAQIALAKSIEFTPQFVEKGGHEAGKEKAMVAYRKQVAQAIIIFCDLEEAFLVGDKDKVAELIDAVKDSKKKGHDEFIEED